MQVRDDAPVIAAASRAFNLVRALDEAEFEVAIMAQRINAYGDDRFYEVFVELAHVDRDRMRTLIDLAGRSHMDLRFDRNGRVFFDELQPK